MSLLSLKGKLLKAFVAAAVISTAVGALPGTMHDAEGAVVVSAGPYSYTHRARANREVFNNVITNPTAEHIQQLQQRNGYVIDGMVPFIAETIAEMNIPPGAKPQDITPEQRDHFMKTLEDKHLVAQMSVDTQEEAAAIGMKDFLLPFFKEVKEQSGLKGPVTLAQARELHEKMFDKHFDAHVQPVFEVTAATVTMAAAAYAMKKMTRT